MSGIHAIVANHLKVLFRDVLNKTGNEFHCRKGFCYRDIIFVSIIVEDDIFTIVIINAGSCDYRATKISADILEDFFRIAKVWFCINIETIFTLFVDVRFPLFERVSDFFMEQV